MQRLFDRRRGGRGQAGDHGARRSTSRRYARPTHFSAAKRATAIIRRDLERGNGRRRSDCRLLAAGQGRVLFIRSPDGRSIASTCANRSPGVTKPSTRIRRRWPKTAIRMGLVKAAKMEPLETLPEETISRDRAGCRRRHRRPERGAGFGRRRIRGGAGRKAAAARRLLEGPEKDISNARSLHGSIRRRAGEQAGRGGFPTRASKCSARPGS